jgi:outer membrane receptor protein involved in Fe transport
MDLPQGDIVTIQIANSRRASFIKAMLLSTAAATTALGTSSAIAQDNLETVVVSASRLTTAGFEAPTPTTVLGSAQIEANALPNLADAVQQLPSLVGNASTQTGIGSTSGGMNGLSTLNARGLGATRTLVLIDGQRVGGANINGVNDISLFPQLLIRRVDVVTGGASASYGSDAVAGVVNFIMNKTFTGFKANLEGSITNYGDDASGLAQFAWGTGLLGDQLHLEVSGEYYKNAGVPSRGYGPNGGPDGRTWFAKAKTASNSIAATPAGGPQNVLMVDAQTDSYALGGLITAGPLKGTAFGPGGTTYRYTYGNPCVGNTCAGGEDAASVENTSSYDDKISRAVGFVHLGYDITPDFNVYANVSYAEVKTLGTVNQGAAQQATLTIQCGNAAGGPNAYLPASINTACITNNITNFQFGVSNLNFPNPVSVQIARKQPRYVVGFEDKIDLLGSQWNFNGYYQHAEMHQVLNVFNSVLIPRYKAALDAVQVTAANQATYPGVAQGTIVCRLPASQAPGCVPFNTFGFGTINPASYAYFNPPYDPFAHTQQRQEAAGIAMSGAPFKDWAGDVSFAFGAEYREEAYHQTADWYGNGLDAISQPNAQYPYDPLLLTTGNNYYAGSFFNGHGSYHVSEGFLEIGVPLLDNADFGKIDTDLAGRFTHYSTSGDIATWKLGATWDTPISGLRLRAVASRDVRAPNLAEESPPPLSANNTLISRIAQCDSAGNCVSAGQSVNLASSTIGNPSLKPERAQNMEAGIVYEPDWLPGFQTSVDYHSIKIDGGIQNFGGQTAIDQCEINGLTQFCSTKYFKLTGVLGTTNLPYSIVQPINLAVLYTSGYDVAAAYQGSLEDFGIPGDINISAKGSHTNNFVTDQGLVNVKITHGAGGTSIPKWKGLFAETWTLEKISLTAQQRVISAGALDPDTIECQSPNCPLPTIQHPTASSNRIPGAIYYDVGGSYQWQPSTQLYFKIDNIANLNPPSPVLGANNVAIYDVLGRFYRIGVRISD